MVMIKNTCIWFSLWENMAEMNHKFCSWSKCANFSFYTESFMVYSWIARVYHIAIVAASNQKYNASCLITKTF